MELATADYAILAVTAVAAVFGLIGGFSGAVAFLAGLFVGSFVARFGWLVSASYLQTSWGRAVATLVIGLVAFGIVRMIIRKIVHGMLAQPADAIFGALVAAASGFALAVGAVFLLGYANILKTNSSLVDLAASALGGR